MRTGARRERLPNWAIGLILIVILALASLYAFTKSVPWSNPHTIQAVFPSSANIRPASPVRIAGVNVGKVTKIEHIAPTETDNVTAQAGSTDDPVPAETPATATVVTMELDDSALPLHTDATMKLRPRLFLEGNLFVDLKPGTPNAPEAEDGYTYPISQTSIAVQIDQVFTTLQADVRSNLQTLLDELGTAFRRGGAEGFREIYKTSPGAFRYTSEVNDAFLGTEEHDLSELIVNLDDTVEALNQGDDIQDLVTNLNTVLGSFAAQSENLERAIAILPDVIEEGKPALASLNASLPALRAFSREALPGVRSTPATLDAATPLLRQVRGLVSKPELRGLTADLRPTIPRLATLTKETIPFLDESRKFASCFNEVVNPWSRQTINDPATPASGQIFEELGYGLTGIASESRSGDSNGPYIRVLAAGGTNTVVLPDTVQEGGSTVDAVGLTPLPLLGGIPAIDSSLKTPYRPDVRCETQEPPDIEAGAPAAAPRTQSVANPIAPSSASPELIDTAKGVQDSFDEALDMAEKGRSAKGLKLQQDAMDTLNEALAEAFDLEYLLPLADQEPVAP
jgi:phospholipid/cholesterol/gamma-HCH transport system substrate-binding protein